MIGIARRLLLVVLAVATVALLGSGVGLLSRAQTVSATGGAATLTAPVNGSTLTGSSATFSWTAGPNTTGYVLWVGSTAGGSDQFASNVLTTGSPIPVGNLPTNSRPLYARLWSYDSSTTTWLASDASYTAAAPTAGLGTLTSPIAGATLAGASQSFTWTAGTGATAYWLTAGSGRGLSDYYSAIVSSTTTSATATGLPTDGRAVYVRLLTHVGQYQAVDYVFTASGSGANRPGQVTQVAPTAGTSGLTKTPTFMWTAPTGSIAGTTTYTVHVYTTNANPPATATGLSLTATTGLLQQVPTSAGLTAGSSYAWTVVACNGTACTTSANSLPLGSWWAFSVAPTVTGTAPGVVSQSSPADGTQNTGTTPTLSWNVPSGAINGVTQYTVALHDAPGGGGTALTPLPETTNTSEAVPAQAALLASHTYSWNVFACAGLLCSPLSSTWWSFSTGTATAGTPGTVSQVSPADHAAGSGTTPTLTWTAPTGAIPGTTSYTVSLWDPSPSPSGTLLAALTPTTALSIAVPIQSGLVNSHSYHWNVNACNGASCSGLASHWFAFSTALAPGTISLASPATGASNQLRNLVLSWSTPTNFLPSQTQFYVSLWDPYAPPAGHRLGDIPCATGCSTSLQVPLSEGLLYGQSYSWNVYACNGEACSSYTPTWWSFTVQNQPAVTLSGASIGLQTGDFSGPGSGWTGDGTYTTSGGFSYLAGFTSITSPPAATGAYRIGYQDSSPLTVQYGTLSGGYTTVFSDNAGTGAWTDASFTVPSNLSGNFTVSGGFGANIAYLQPESLATALTYPRLDNDGRLPKPVGGSDGSGVDVVSGAFGYTHTDLSLPGVSGNLSFSRAYTTAGVTTRLVGNATQNPGPLGPKWTHTWQYNLWQVDSSTTALQLPGGQTVTFSLGVSQAGADATVVQVDSTHWTVTTAAQVQYGFTTLQGVQLLTTVRDRNLNTTALAYDSSNRLTTVTDAGGRYLTLGYTGTGTSIASVTDSAGRSVHYSYDPTSGDLTQVTDVLSGVTKYGYSSGTHLLTQVTDPLNNVVLKNTYDPAGTGRVTTQTDAALKTFTFQYGVPGAGATKVLDQRSNPRTYYFDTAFRITDVLDAYGNRLSANFDSDNNTTLKENQLGGAMTGTFDAQGNQLTSTDAWNYTSYFTFDNKNNRLTATDPLNHLTKYTYDARGNRLTTTDPLNETTTNTVNGLGQVTAVQDPRGYSTTYGFNTSGDRTTVTDPLTHATTTTYDTAGRPTSVTDALNHVFSKTYNAAGNVLTEFNSPSTGVTDTTTSTYDADWHKKTVTDPNNHTTTYAYDVRGLLSTVTDANTPAGLTTYGYDAAGNRTSVKDAKNQTTNYTFDNDNRLSTVTDPLSNVLSTATYDAAGRVATRKDGKNQTTTYTYTVRDQLDHRTYPDTSTVQYQYDALGSRTSMVESTGTTSYLSDALKRPTSITFPGAKTVGYGYDADGNRASITYPGGTHQVSYGYDTADRLTSVTDWNSKQTTYAYDNANRLTTTVLPAGSGGNFVTSTDSYDNANRLTAISHTLGATTLASASYTLDSAGNRTQKTTPAGNETYTLDVLNRLTNVVYPDSTSTAYSYDAVGNRSTMVTAPGTTNYAYDAADRLTSVTPPGSGAVTNAYDTNDSQTTRGSDSFAWDYENRATTTTVSGTAYTETYNGDGLRQSRTTGGVTTGFVWDTASKLPVILDDGTQYIYGVAVVARTSGIGTYYFLADGLGSTVAIVDGTGAVVQTYSYDVFGAVKASTGTQGTEFQFAGQETDPSGLQYLRARQYDPNAGRFLSIDTDRGCSRKPLTQNLFVYVTDDPVLLVDPTGHNCTTPPGDSRRDPNGPGFGIGASCPTAPNALGSGPASSCGDMFLRAIRCAAAIASIALNAEAAANGDPGAEVRLSR